IGLRVAVKQQQRRAAAADLQIYRRTGSLDLTLAKAGEKFGHLSLHAVVIARRHRRRNNLLPPWPATEGDCFATLAMTALSGLLWRAFQLDGVAVRVGDVDRRAVAFG